VDISPTLTPRSDQLNADDLIAGPITITVTAVKKGSREQPVEVHYEGGDGRPYKPSKSMRRVLAYIWSPQASEWTGRSLTLYRDDSIKFGGEAVGGIRISHASHIDAPKKLALTVTRGKRVPYEVQPLPSPATPTPEPTVTPEVLDELRREGGQSAAEGMGALREFWAALTSNQKHAFKVELEKDWKPAAAKADAQKAAQLEEFAL